ncbi:MAG: GspJ family T2SS minor pseudopilin variant XcpW [Gammaproteobacteria bacterium]|nr:MAG: GspJ family T2SS minor pseudopilin variant XcpW [Gammaproteobacteria bacterium]
MQTAKHMPVPTARQRGFTLLELLIASIIFAIMAIMAYGGLANVMENSKSSERALKRLQQVQQTVSILNRDFLQLVPRAVRDEYGNLRPALSTPKNLDNLVEFTRGGRINPANLLRSTLVRVAYQFDDDKLVRLQWPQLDNAPGVKAKKTTLIDNVEKVTIRFLDQKGNWHEQWPPLNAATGTNGGVSAEFIAIEIVLQLNDWGEIRRLYAMN